MSIGSRIKKRRLSLEWSQRELAKRMGYTNNSTIVRIENGSIDIPQSKIVKFSEVLDVPIAYLMGWDEKPAETAAVHVDILADVEFTGMYANFVKLDPDQKKMIRSLVDGLAKTK